MPRAKFHRRMIERTIYVNLMDPRTKRKPPAHAPALTMNSMAPGEFHH